MFDMMWGGNIKTRRPSRPTLTVLAAVGLAEHKPPSEQEERDQREEMSQFVSGPIL